MRAPAIPASARSAQPSASPEGAAQRDEQSRSRKQIAKKAGWRRPAPGECSQTENADGFERHENQDPVDELRVYHEGAHARSAGRLALGQ
ncbi:MAG: hypothetical protein FD172_2841 [Methylocystaceae bacterium]|nr:MAG: hypothetical protein FD172_2841 [Methylocystaceae bacterium]